MLHKLAMATITAVAAASGTGGTVPNHGAPGEAPPPPTTVTVENQLHAPVTIYVEHGAFDLRLGAVPATASSVFEIPSWMVRPESPVTVFVHPAKGAEQSSGSIEIRQGEHLGLLIPDRGRPVSRAVEVPTRWGEPTTVTVENGLKGVVHVYAEHGNVDLRLGVVQPNSSMVFEIPSWMVEPEGLVNVFVRPAKGFEQSTGPLEVHRGEHLGVKVPQR